MQNERPESVEEAEAQARGDYRWLLEDPRGRRIARAIMRWSGIDETGPIEGAEKMAIATGSRIVGNVLKAQLIKHAPELYVRLESEHVQELAWAAARDAARAAEHDRENPEDLTP